MNRSIFIAIFLGFISLASGSAQDVPDIGIKPSGSYFNGAVDHVDLFTGNVYGNIPLRSYSQLGKLPALSFSINFNNSAFTQVEYCDPTDWTDCSVEDDIFQEGGYPEVRSNLDELSTLSTCDAEMTLGGDLAGTLEDGIYGYIPCTSTPYITATDVTGHLSHFMLDTKNTDIAYSVDGSGYTLTNLSTVDLNLKPGGQSGIPLPALHRPDGVTIARTSFWWGKKTRSYTYGNEYDDAITDTSGNKIQHLYYGDNQYLPYFADGIPSGSNAYPMYVDSVGRVIPDMHSITTMFTTDVNTKWPQTSLSTDVSLCPNLGTGLPSPIYSYTWNMPEEDSYLFCYIAGNVYSSYRQTGKSPLIAVLLQSAVIPSGDYWGFVYDACPSTAFAGGCIPEPGKAGNLVQIRYPTGAKVVYTYDKIYRWPKWTDPSYYYGVTSRIEYDVNKNARTTTYSYAKLTDTIFTTTVTDGMQNDVVHTFTDLAKTKQAYETEVDYYQGSATTGKLLKSVSMKYQSMPDKAIQEYYDNSIQYFCWPNGFIGGQTCNYGALEASLVNKITNVLPTSIVTSNDQGTVTTSNYAYSYFTDEMNEAYWTNADSISTTDSSSNTVVEKNAPLFTGSPAYGPPSSTSTGTNQYNLVAAEGVTDSSSNVISLTKYGYDDSSLSAGTRGNQTTVSKWINTGASSLSWSTALQSTLSSLSGKFATTQIAYNSLGSQTSRTDPMGNITSVNSFQCSGLFPLSITSATNYAVPETSQSAKDCYTGNVTSSVDDNKVKTVYTYKDSLDRLTSVQSPAYSLTATYPDMNTVIVKRDQNAVSDGLVQTTDIYNGLGQITQHIAANGAEIDTYYDSNGRVAAVSNPYFATSDPTYGITAYTYDALGRKTQQCEPDNSSPVATVCTPNSDYQTWSYSGLTTTYTDQNGHPWQRVSDGLGRLTQVVEPNKSVTQYSYDLLDNLLSVNQWGQSSKGNVSRVRSFNYDSLSRLLCASNPENSSATCPSVSAGSHITGTTGYTYDNNGNVQKKTDASGVIMSYTYDALNRVTSKVYSSDKSGTPISCFQYDTSSGTGVNLTGRLTNAWTQPAGTKCTSSGGSYTPQAGSYLSLKSILAYDSMGRPTSAQQQQCVGSKCSASAPYSLTMAYDLAGNMTSLTNSVGANNQPLTLSHTYDGATRPCLTTSSWSGNFPANLFQTNSSTTTPGYASFGGLQNWYLGSTSATASTSCDAPTSPINITQGYTNRLWLNSISATGQIP